MEGRVEPKWRLDVSLVPKRLQEAPKRLQEAPKRLQVDSKLAPRGAQEAPSWLQEAPKRLQEAPKTLQVGSKRRPRAAQDASRGAQEASKSHETAAQVQFDSKQRHLVKTMVFLRKIDVFAGQERSRRPAWRAKWSPSGAWRPAWRAKCSPRCVSEAQLEAKLRLYVTDKRTFGG